MNMNYSEVVDWAIKVESESCEVRHTSLVIVEEDFGTGHLDGVILLYRYLGKARETGSCYHNIKTCRALDVYICIFVDCSNVQVIIFSIFTDTSSLLFLVKGVGTNLGRLLAGMLRNLRRDIMSLFRTQ